MDPSEVVNGIREYTGNGYGVHMDTLIIAQSTIEDVLGYILGLLAFFIGLGMMLITALDVMYITMPIFQDSVNNKRWDGSQERKIRIISADAINAVERATTDGSGSAMKLYLKSRVKTYIICGVILYLLLAGSSVLIHIVTKVVLGILNSMSNVHIVK